MTGMRRGEVCGLRWSDIDLETGVVEVRQQLFAVDHALVFSEHPKTDHGRRRLELDPETVGALRAQRLRQLERRMAIGPGYNDSGLVYTKLDGSPVHPENVTAVFVRRVAR